MKAEYERMSEDEAEKISKCAGIEDMPMHRCQKCGFESPIYGFIAERDFRLSRHEKWRFFRESLKDIKKQVFSPMKRVALQLYCILILVFPIRGHTTKFVVPNAEGILWIIQMGLMDKEWAKEND